MSSCEILGNCRSKDTYVWCKRGIPLFNICNSVFEVFLLETLITELSCKRTRFSSSSNNDKFFGKSFERSRNSPDWTTKESRPCSRQSSLSCATSCRGTRKIVSMKSLYYGPKCRQAFGSLLMQSNTDLVWFYIAVVYFLKAVVMLAAFLIF